MKLEFSRFRKLAHLKSVNVAVHATSSSGAERTAGVALGRLGGAGVVDRVVAQILWHLVALIQPLLDLGVRNVASHHERAGEAQPCADRILRQEGLDVGHRAVQVDLDDVMILQLLFSHLQQGDNFFLLGAVTERRQ